MDTSILYIILTGLVFVGLAILYLYLKKKYDIKNEDLFRNLDTLDVVINTGIMIARDMNFGDEKTLEILKHVITETFEFIKVVAEENSDDIISVANLKAREMCKVFNLEMTEERTMILETIITMSYNLYTSIEATKNEELVI